MDLYPELLRIPLTSDGKRVDWGNVPYPRGSIGSIKSLQRQQELKKPLYLAVPHFEEIIRVSILNIESGVYVGLPNGTKHSFVETNIQRRTSTNANFVFHNYWQAYAYLLKYKKLPREAYINDR